MKKGDIVKLRRPMDKAMADKHFELLSDPEEGKVMVQMIVDTPIVPVSLVTLEQIELVNEHLLHRVNKLNNIESCFTCSITGMEFVFVKGGTFQMGDIFGDGDDDEKPFHEVTVSDFSIGKYQVTQGEWMKIMGNNPSKFKNGNHYPVEQVSWNDVQDFIKKLNQKSGRKYCLPTEAEWEYAARSGGKKEVYSGSDNAGSVAWGNGKISDGTHPVGQKLANGLGLYDMCGNIMEWCQDFYDKDYYKNSPQKNPYGPETGILRVCRGGMWHDGDWDLRTGRRGNSRPDSPAHFIGFRLLCGGTAWEQIEKEERERKERETLFQSKLVHYRITDDVILDKRNGLMWARNANIVGKRTSWEEAMKWARSLNCGGYSDWRLPTKEELEAHAKRDGNHPMEFFNVIGFQNVQGEYFASNPCPQGAAWAVFIAENSCKSAVYTNAGLHSFAWPVRRSLS